MSYPFVVVGGGIAGVTCVETLSALCPDIEILLIAASKLIKAISNFQKHSLIQMIYSDEGKLEKLLIVSKTLEQFDVEERQACFLEKDCPNVTVLNNPVLSLDTDRQVLRTQDGTEVAYKYLCICTGGKPKIIAKDNPYVIGIRDTESVQDFQKRLRKARRIMVVGNGGIATELVYEVEGCEVIWAIKDKSISHTFIDPGAATFFLPHLNEDKPLDEKKPLRRRKYTTELTEDQGESKLTESLPVGSALGPDWASDREMKGANKEGRPIHVEYKVEVARLLTAAAFLQSGKKENSPPNLSPPDTGGWPIYVELTNNCVYGCDFVVSATGVEPNTDPFISNQFDIAEDGGILVNDKMETSIGNVYAAGDVCTASWKPAPHWLQMRLWSQARQMGAYAAKSMVAKYQGEDIQLDFCFEMFAHVTKFFNYKVILLGKFNAQGSGGSHELLLRLTKGQEFIKAVLQDGRLQGAILIGETDLEETFENLILNQIDLTPFKEHLLDPNIDIEDFFD